MSTGRTDLVDLSSWPERDPADRSSRTAASNWAPSNQRCLPDLDIPVLPVVGIYGSTKTATPLKSAWTSQMSSPDAHVV